MQLAQAAVRTLTLGVLTVLITAWVLVQIQGALMLWAVALAMGLAVWRASREA